MSEAYPHLDDETLSALVDGRLTLPEAASARAHLRGCPACGHRWAELGAVASLLRALPEVEPPRDFSLGPRALAPEGEPAPVVRGVVAGSGRDAPSRLTWWYRWTRVVASAAAASFLVLAAGEVYLRAAGPVGGAPAVQGASEGARTAYAPPAPAATASVPEQLQAPGGAAPPVPSGPRDAQAAQPAARSAAPPAPPGPQVAPMPSPPAADVAALEQRAAATQQRPIATQTPTVRLLGVAAIGFGLLAVASALAALALRNRLRPAPEDTSSEEDRV